MITHFRHAILFAVSTVLLLDASWLAAQTRVERALERIDTDKGIIVVCGLPQGGAASLVSLAEASELTIYFQSANSEEVTAVYRAADNASLLGSRIFADRGALSSIQLADNVADSVLVARTAGGQVDEAELLRVVRPRGAVWMSQRRLVKPVPDGIDEWSHAYHGPDNNPQSNDEHVKGDFRTQFVGEPKFSPMPEQSVIAGGRIYKAMGHIAHKANQNAVLNTLMCINAYNGTVLWRRPLSEGFMIHRNTMIATVDALYMGDHESCKVIDGKTGEVRREYKVGEDISDGPVWKWMAIENGTLYALVGNPEISVDTQTSNRRGIGHWPWGMWKGHDYKDPRTAFGFGRTFVAIDLESGEQKWHFRDEEFLDARGVCMKNGRLYAFSPERFLACIDNSTGDLLWKNSDKDLLEAIGPNSRAQGYITGYATTCYMKCNDDYLFFAGPQREKLVVASAKDGGLQWTKPVGNLQLVLRDNGVYAAGPQRTTSGLLDYATGNILEQFPARRACTRATGCADSIFFRASGGTVRVLTATNTAQHIAPMRPPCQDGVLISNGHLYWGPWMCGCQLSLYGNIALCPATSPTTADSEDRLVRSSGEIAKVEPLDAQPNDWTTFRGNNSRTDLTPVSLPANVSLAWEADIHSSDLPTAPVAAGGFVFVGDRSGAVQALDGDGNQVWKAYTGGPIYYPPVVAHDRLYVGSADGRVYAYEAQTGRQLWAFRVAPGSHRIPVFGKLISLWPVAGGVVVEGNTVYAAAGITHYDGTHVVALDAITGELKAHNGESGTLSAEVNSGISLQGDLSIVDGELQFLGGGIYETARYDLETLECRNEPKVQVTAQFRTAFHPYYPEYNKYVSLEYACGDGNMLYHGANYDGSAFANLSLQTPLPKGTPGISKDAAGEFLRRRGQNVPKPKNVWQDKTNRRFTSFVVGANDRILGTGHPDLKPNDAFLAAIDVETGSDAWVRPLPAVAVPGGTAIDHAGRIYVSLENGQLLCFTADDAG